MSELTFRLRGLTERQVDEHRPDRTLRASTRLVLTTIAIVALVYSDQIHKAIAVGDRTGVSLLQAKQAVQLAERTNAHGVFILNEGIDKARALKDASGTDVAAAAHIVSIRFNRVGGATVAVVSPAIAGVSILYTVSGTDTYYASKTLPTDGSGSVSFMIPARGPA